MIFGIRKLESRATLRLCLHDPTFSRFGTIAACDRRTDGRTNRPSDGHMATSLTALTQRRAYNVLAPDVFQSQLSRPVLNLPHLLDNNKSRN